MERLENLSALIIVKLNPFEMLSLQISHPAVQLFHLSTSEWWRSRVHSTNVGKDSHPTFARVYPAVEVTMSTRHQITNASSSACVSGACASYVMSGNDLNPSRLFFPIVFDLSPSSLFQLLTICPCGSQE